MNKPELEISQFETRVAQAARGFVYPRTPMLRPRVSTRPQRVRRLALVLLVVLVLMAGVLAVPQVRAAVLRVLRLGAVQIIVPDAWPDPLPTPTAAITRTSTPLPPHTLLGFGGKTTLSHAQQQLSFAIQLPAYPANLGNPDMVYLQNDFDRNDVLILAWTRGRPQAQVHMSLHIVRSAGDNPIYTKMRPRLMQETQVKGRRALWVEGPYLVQLRNGDFDARYLITGRALIWTEGTGERALTYRLETALPLDEAIQVAESLQPITAR